MIRVDERSPSAKFRIISLENPEQAARWLASLEGQLADLHASAQDRLCKKRNRVLSRHEARRQFREAEWAITQLLASAKAGLNLPDFPAPEPEQPEQESSNHSSPESDVTPPSPPPGGAGE